MLLVVHHNSLLPDVPAGALESILAVLGAWGVDFRLWLGAFSAEAHLKYKLQVGGGAG